MNCKTVDMLDLTKTKAAPLLLGVEYPWEALDKLKSFILEIGAFLPENEYDHPQPDVWIAKDAVIFGSAFVKGPCIIGHKTEVRQCAFIRG
ncbi:MAG TPA: UDP-N-acetylglucosamine pyrophosphorylase, partial [Oscillospiraceae bacterium]|nr:UDP-N-acetylglucosamine pyrophosphorylase [Oscillospiraceae bacterium]